jgi:hypothetical protein
VHHVTQHQIDAGIIAQPRERRVDVVGLVEFCAARDRDARGLAQFAGERTDDQKTSSVGRS